MSQRRLAIMCDIDGTIALRNERSPYRWTEADADLPNAPVVLVLHALYSSGLEVVFVSGRPEDARLLTQGWLDRELGIPGRLFLRPNHDFRRDVEVKRETYENDIEPHYEVVLVLDDRDQVVRMWRDDLHLTCFQVAQGDF